MSRILLLFAVVSILNSYSQQSIHQEQSAYYSALGYSAADYEYINRAATMPAAARATCTLNKVVYGWHPYWSNGLETNYNWNLLSHFCYFSYEVDAATGNAITTNGFSTASSVTTALASGVKVNLCATLFSSHATLLSNATSRQNLITNLINLISARGAHGVNIDFEGLPLSQKTNFTTFMNDLAAQMHAAIPGSEVSTVLYAVDWNNVIDVAAMPNVDMFIIMGYDYYWSGSTTAGPNDPLFQFGTTYNYTLSKSITYYLNKGVPNNKLILGLPYYGREWAVTSSGIPATASGSGVSRIFSYVKTNASGNYSSANRNFDSNSYSAYYQFTSGSLKQCFITEGYEMNKRMDVINKRGIGGMGIWALGYDDGYNDFWNAIEANFTDCYSTPCNDTLFDIGGGPNKNYYDNENYTYTLSPPGASSISVNFSSFNLENNFDYLYIYDGASTSATQFSGSPFTGTTSPGTITSSTGSITFRFTSNNATTSPGFTATYSCLSDVIPPTTSVNVTGSWQTINFNAAFTDADNIGGSGVNEKYYQVLDFNGTEWRANNSFGFFNDNFTSAIHPDWTNASGIFGINTSRLEQTDNANANTNLYAAVVQNNSYQYLYHWQMNQTGTGTNRRAGLHFFCDNPSLTNRGNSYFVYYRVDSDRCQIYEVISDTYYLMADIPVVINSNVWYDCKVTYNPTTGLIQAYMDNALVAEWTDTTPLISGNSISIRTGGTSALYDDIKVYKSRSASQLVTIGSLTDEVRYQNFGLLQNSCKINSVINDNSLNWSNVVGTNVNIDWTVPTSVLTVSDSLSTDVDVQYNNSFIAANYSLSSDANSGVNEYWYSVGLSPGDSSVVSWTNNSTNTFFNRTGLSLTYGVTYFVNIRVKNGAALLSAISSSDGVLIVAPASPPVSSFSLPVTEFCILDSVQLNNTTSGAINYLWSGIGVNFDNPNAINPFVQFDTTGTFPIQLIAMGPGGNDTLIQNVSVIIHDVTAASFTTSADTVYLPSGFTAFTNSSTNASIFSWIFGDGNTSSDSDPWNIYLSVGNFSVILIAGNGFCPSDTATMNVVVLNPTSITEENIAAISIYPNPVTNVLTVSSNNIIRWVKLFNAEGKMVMHQNINLNKLNLDVHAFSEGAYEILMSVNGNQFKRRIIIQK